MRLAYHTGAYAAALFSLTACTTNDTVVPPTPVVIDDTGILNTGSPDGTGTLTGLPFAGDEDGFDPTTPVTLRMARLIVDDDGQARIEVTDTPVTATASGGSFSIDGEVLTFTATDDSEFEATSASGQQYLVQLTEVSEGSGQIGELLGFDAANGDLLESAGYTVAVLQTNPDNQPEGGNFIYDGDLAGRYTVTDLDGNNASEIREMEGTVAITVDFGSAAVTGEVNMSSEDFTMSHDLTPTDLVGNGFGTSLERTDACPTTSCGGNSLIGGNIVHEDSEYMTGLFILDEFETGGEDGDQRFMGTGFFEAEENDP